MMSLIQQPWPWYVAGPLIGLIVPFLLLIDGKQFCISSSFRHILSISGIKRPTYFSYDWKKEKWNLFFVTGIIVGASFAQTIIGIPDITLNPKIVIILKNMGVTDFTGFHPNDFFTLVPKTPAGWILTLIGGYLIGFGTRWASGCTAGHTILGLALFNKTSLIATTCFFIGGLLSARIIVPFILLNLN